MLAQIAFMALLAASMASTVALVEKRLGPVTGGLLQGTPVIAFPVLLFIGVTKSSEYFTESALFAFIGMLPLQLTLVAYGASAALNSTTIVTLLAAGTWLVTAALMSKLSVLVGLITTTVAIVPILIATSRWFSPPDRSGQSWSTIASKLPARATIAFTVVSVMGILSSSLEGTWIGLLTTFPTTSAILLSFNHAGGGEPRVRLVLAGINRTVPALAIFVGCCLVFAKVAPVVVAPFLSLLVSLTYGLSIFAWARIKATR